MIRIPTPTRRHVLPVLIVAALAGCGGGGDGAPAVGGAAAQGGGAAPGPSGAEPAPAAAPAVAAAPSATCGLSGFADSALAYVNRMRAAGASCGSRGTFAPAAALGWSSKLTQSGEAHALDMATANYFSHTSIDGRTLADRVNATGYAWTTIGENIAAGFSSVSSVMDGWTASPGHCANLMNPAFTEIGLACVAGGASSSYSTYWTMNLGQPR